MVQERLLRRFLEYVSIDSETLCEEAFMRRLIQELDGMGIPWWTDQAGKTLGSNANNLYAWLEGDASAEPILLSGHMDTVRPGKGIRPQIQDGVLQSQGDTILGGDDKAGVAAIMEALHTVVENRLAHRPVQIVFSIYEEGGVRGASKLEFHRLKAHQAVVFDCEGDVGKIVVSAPGQTKLYVDVFGKSAHAGFCPEQGISAISAAALGISRMRLLRIDSETTANIGTFSACYATNIVPQQAHIEAEARSHSLEKLESQIQHMVDCLKGACQETGATLKYIVEPTYQPYHLPKEHPLVTLVSGRISRLGISPQIISTGGGSDANHFNAHGIPAVVVSTGMEQVHTTHERLTLENLFRCGKLALELIQL